MRHHERIGRSGDESRRLRHRALTRGSQPLRYSPRHTWVRAEDDGSVTIGITAYAQYELGELQYVGLPRVGSAVKKDEPFGEVESTKTASDLYAPCSGAVLAVNPGVEADPPIVNRDPYGAGWMIRVAPAAPDELPGFARSGRL